MCARTNRRCAPWRNFTFSVVASAAISLTLQPSQAVDPVPAASSVVSEGSASGLGPFDLAEGTDIYTRNTLAMPGHILSATTKTASGSKEADIRTIGQPLINGQSRASGQPVQWGECVVIGGIYNAGETSAVVTFSARVIVDLAPGEIIFTSSVMTLAQVEAALLDNGFLCRCKCQCFGCEDNPVAYVICSEAPTPGNCESLENETCEIGDCTTGKLIDCERVYRKPIVSAP